MMVRSTRGFTALEVVVAILVLAVAVLPIIDMTTSGRQAAALTEYHVIAQRRALRILEVYASEPYDRLRRLPRDAEGVVTAPVPFDDPVFPDEYRKKLATCDERVCFQELEPGLGMVTVEIRWRPGGGERRSIERFRFYGDERLSLTDRYPLRQEGASRDS